MLSPFFLQQMHQFARCPTPSPKWQRRRSANRSTWHAKSLNHRTMSNSRGCSTTRWRPSASQETAWSYHKVSLRRRPSSFVCLVTRGFLKTISGLSRVFRSRGLRLINKGESQESKEMMKDKRGQTTLFERSLLRIRLLRLKGAMSFPLLGFSIFSA